MNTLQSTDLIDTLREYTVRPAQQGDAQAVLDVYVAADRADNKNWAGDLDEVQQDFDNPSVRLGEDTRLVFSSDGRLAAVAWLFVNEEAETERRAFLWGVVHPEFRQRGIGSALLSWMEGAASRRLREFSDGIRPVLTANSVDGLQDRMALYQEHGFKAARYYYKMRRDLSDPIPNIPLPEGYEEAGWNDETADQFRRVIDASFRDHWGSQPITDLGWNLHFLESSNARRDLSFGLTYNGELVAETFNRRFEEDNRREGISEGWIGTLGVLREHRGKGLASYLLCESMRRFKEMGWQYAGLSVDTENLTGALRLYENLGFVPVKRNILWQKDPLPPD